MLAQKLRLLTFKSHLCISCYVKINTLLDQLWSLGGTVFPGFLRLASRSNTWFEVELIHIFSLVLMIVLLLDLMSTATIYFPNLVPFLSYRTPRLK